MILKCKVPESRFTWAFTQQKTAISSHTASENKVSEQAQFWNLALHIIRETVWAFLLWYRKKMNTNEDTSKEVCENSSFYFSKCWPFLMLLTAKSLEDSKRNDTVAYMPAGRRVSVIPKYVPSWLLHIVQAMLIETQKQHVSASLLETRWGGRQGKAFPTLSSSRCLRMGEEGVIKWGEWRRAFSQREKHESKLEL